ncbi:MAG: hypothetical protein U9Q69_05115 [Nanoarchaeota archaeon]|nr:hypothetical protein [Nanoarchaeota archaeon]
MKKIKWCLKVKKGIELVEPNDNLSKVYLNKSEDALKAAASLKGNRSWEISSNYYAMYFALYSIFLKVGVKCENHTCTLELMKNFFLTYFTKEDVKLIKDSMGLRIEAQYYLDKKISQLKYRTLIKKSPYFIIKCKDIRFKT